MAEPATVTTGDYKVLVIVNPSNKLKGNNSDFDEMDARTLYNTILDREHPYSYSVVDAYADNYENAANSIGMGLGYDGSLEEGTETGNFMMANKAEASVTLNQTNENTPAKVNVDVERVLSKITFRSKPANEAEKTGENVYKVEGVKIGSAPAKTVTGCTLSDKQPGTYTLNIATDALGKTIYALYDDNGFVAAYREAKDNENNVYQKLTAVSTANWDDESTDQENSYAVVDVDPDDNEGELTDAEKADIDLEFDPDAEVATKDWYVRLEGYALVNLSKSVNYVRHTVTGDVVTPFGTLDGSNFLWTPNWGDKNDVVFKADANGEMQFDPTTFTTNTWFYNTLADVSTESANLQINTTGGNRTFSLPSGNVQYFKTFDSMYDDGSTVTGSDHYADAPKLPAVGKLMSYCFENSTDIEHQTHGLSTGITFVATIWNDAACTEKIDRLYLYKGHNYTSIDQMKEAYGSAVPDAIKDLTDSSSKEELEKAGVKLYNSNTCYYYTTEIKHYDNNQDQVLGNMEFAIMRNNIYSLAVSTITQIGDPIVDPTPGTENESEEAKLEVSAKILPWIVRYNDIEF